MKTASLLLGDEGLEVRLFGSAQEILGHAVTAPGALAVVDVLGISHATLSTEERDQLGEFARAVPTVLVTTRDWATDGMAEELGFAALVRKPFDVAELSEVVRACVEIFGAKSESARGRARRLRVRSGLALERLEQSRERLKQATES